MVGFYNLLDKLKEELLKSPFVKTVTYGDIYEVDLNKTTIFPLSHFIVNSATYNSQVITFSLSLICADIIDESKDNVTDQFRGNDNEQDIFNTQLNVVTRLMDMLQRGDLYADKFQLNGTPNIEAFTDRFDNKLAGWTVSFDIDVANDMSIC
jgi:hypothetical protein